MNVSKNSTIWCCNCMLLTFCHKTQVLQSFCYMFRCCKVGHVDTSFFRTSNRYKHLVKACSRHQEDRCAFGPKKLYFSYWKDGNNGSSNGYLRHCVMFAFSKADAKKSSLCQKKIFSNGSSISDAGLIVALLLKKETTSLLGEDNFLWPSVFSSAVCEVIWDSGGRPANTL